MNKWIPSIVAMCMLACSCPQEARPETLSPENGPGYLIRLNFIILKEEYDKHPNVVIALKQAMRNWVDSIPIECAVFVEEQLIYTEPGLIHIRIVDVQDVPYSMPEDVLGYWFFKTNELFLDGDSLEFNADKALIVCLHELGHVFGLPHISNQKDLDALTGAIIAPDEIDAETLVMHATCSDDNLFAKLSKLEIEVARKNLLSLQDLRRNDCLDLTYR